jgi:hypothetical protein
MMRGAPCAYQLQRCERQRARAAIVLPSPPRAALYLIWLADID